MIYITGDTHGKIDFQRLKEYFSNIYVSEKDVLIILGDAGIVWSQKDCYIFDYSMLGLTILFIDGNHENFTLLNRFPIVTKFGAKAHRLNENIYHVKRGEILKINGKTFFCLGGATSIDKHLRKEGVSWWNEENISEEDILNSKINLQKVNYRVDYVLTHAGPSSIVYWMFKHPADRNTMILEELLCKLKFKEWFFGHYHEDRAYKNFRCFYYDILTLPYPYVGIRKNLNIPEFRSDDDDKYLRSRKTGRMFKLLPQDLPEWYLKGYLHYYSLKGVKDYAFRPSPFDNHIDKDSVIYLSYDGKIDKGENLEPKERFPNGLASLWRCSLIQVVKGLEKYSPELDYTSLKAEINLVYDQYNNRSELDYHIGELEPRPYPHVKTRRYKSWLRRKEAKYILTQGDNVITQFLELENAELGLKCYLKKKFNLQIDNLVFDESADVTFEMDLPSSANEKLVLKKF